MKDNNYDQIENFVEYEDYIANSYFNLLTKYLGYYVDFYENSGTQTEFAKTFFTNMKDQIQHTDALLADFSTSKKK